MNTNLTRGLKFLYEMEQSLYYMNHGYGVLQGEIESLGKHKKLYKPEKERSEGKGLNVFFSSLIICSIVGAVIGCIHGLFFVDNPFFRRIATGIAGIVAGVLYGAGAGAAIGIISGIVTELNDSKKREEKYKAGLERYNSNIIADTERVEVELKQKKILLNQNDTLVNKYHETSKLLNDYYNTMGIDEKYRGIVVIRYMYEFARLGICDCLEGPFGLYKVIDEKLDREIMKYTLSEISYKLDILAEQQADLYRELKSINISCEQILQSTIKAAKTSAKNNELLEKAVENTAISSYYSQLAYDHQIYRDFFSTY